MAISPLGDDSFEPLTGGPERPGANAEHGCAGAQGESIWHFFWSHRNESLLVSLALRHFVVVCHLGGGCVVTGRLSA